MTRGTLRVFARALRRPSVPHRHHAACTRSQAVLVALDYAPRRLLLRPGRRTYFLHLEVAVCCVMAKALRISYCHWVSPRVSCRVTALSLTT